MECTKFIHKLILNLHLWVHKALSNVYSLNFRDVASTLVVFVELAIHCSYWWWTNCTRIQSILKQFRGQVEQQTSSNAGDALLLVTWLMKILKLMPNSESLAIVGLHSMQRSWPAQQVLLNRPNMQTALEIEIDMLHNYIFVITDLRRCPFHQPPALPS